MMYADLKNTCIYVDDLISRILIRKFIGIVEIMTEIWIIILETTSTQYKDLSEWTAGCRVD